MQIEVVGNDSQSLINLVSIFPELEDTALKFVDEPTFESDVTLMDGMATGILVDEEGEATNESFTNNNLKVYIHVVDEKDKRIYVAESPSDPKDEEVFALSLSQLTVKEMEEMSKKGYERQILSPLRIEEIFKEGGNFKVKKSTGFAVGIKDEKEDFKSLVARDGMKISRVYRLPKPAGYVDAVTGSRFVVFPIFEKVSQGFKTAIALLRQLSGKGQDKSRYTTSETVVEAIGDFAADAIINVIESYEIDVGGIVIPQTASSVVPYVAENIRKALASKPKIYVMNKIRKELFIKRLDSELSNKDSKYNHKDLQDLKDFMAGKNVFEMDEALGYEVIKIKNLIRPLRPVANDLQADEVSKSIDSLGTLNKGAYIVLDDSAMTGSTFQFMEKVLNSKGIDQVIKFVMFRRK
jgi:phosphoribosylpyrophosphate synthetase